MEDTHGVAGMTCDVLQQFIVLILIIMEDTHGGHVCQRNAVASSSLNPYYNGRYSWSSH